MYRLAEKQSLEIYQTSCEDDFNMDSIIADRFHFENFGVPRYYSEEELVYANNVGNKINREMPKVRKRLRKKKADLQHRKTFKDVKNNILKKISHDFIVDNKVLQLIHLRHQYYGFSEGFEFDKISFTRFWDMTENDDEYGEGILCRGTHKLLDPLVDGVDIRLNSAVIRVDWSDPDATNEISITTSCGDTIYATNVISTVSLGVLKYGNIRFQPPLPALVVDSINRCEMGLLDIVVLRFDTVFWPQDKTLFAACPPIPADDNVNMQNNNQFSSASTTSTQCTHPRNDLFSHFYNLTLFRSQFDANTPLLMAEVSGDKARIIECMSHEEIADAAVETLKIIFGSALSERPVGCVVHKWGTDEFAYGSWNNYVIGVSPQCIQNLCEPLCSCNTNSLFSSHHLSKTCLQFAGEGTSMLKMGTLQGAYESGERAARHILKHHNR